MSATQGLVCASNLSCALLVGALAVPLVRGRVAPNRWYGARWRRAFESEELWYAINRHAGRRLLVWSAVVALVGVAALLVPLEADSPWVLPLALAPAVYLVGALESYLFARRL